jgi:DNA-binding winged helix-turn-helix (wHTH) protein
MNLSDDSQHYSITQKEIKCINILIRTIQEAINRNTFTEQEINKIINVTEILSSRQTTSPINHT